MRRTADGLTATILATVMAATSAVAAEQAVPDGSNGGLPEQADDQLRTSVARSSEGGELTLHDTFTGDIATFGVGGVRDLDLIRTPFASLQVDGVGEVSRALLYWHGPTDRVGDNAGSRVTFAGQEIVGTQIGYADDNCWGYDNSQAYRADVSGLVEGDGSYVVSDFISRDVGRVNANGFSLVVLHDDGDTSNDVEATVYNGNDSNVSSQYDPEGWNALLAVPLGEPGTTRVELHVADGQGFTDAAVLFGGQLLTGAGAVFQGTTVPDAGSASTTNGGLWDVRSLGAGVVEGAAQLTSGLRSDCLSLVAAIVQADVADAYIVPREQTIPAGERAALSLRLREPAPDGAVARFEVVSGPNAGLSGLCDPGTEFGFPFLAPSGFAEPSCLESAGPLTLAPKGYRFAVPSNGTAGTDTVVAWIDLDDDGAAGPEEPTARSTINWSAAVDYLALGDSYSSGDGASPYLPGSRDSDGKDCDRSEGAYSSFVSHPTLNPAPTLRDLADDTTSSWRFWACAGARTFNMYDSPDPNVAVFAPDVVDQQFDSEPLQNAQLGSDIDLVTMTIGGNDTGFAPVLTACALYDFIVAGANDRPPSCANAGPFSRLGGLSVREYVDQNLGRLGPRLSAVWGQAIDRAPDATIVVSGYPQLYDTTPAGLVCGEPFDDATLQYFAGVTTSLNALIRGRAALTGIYYADPVRAFDGHQICGPRSSWFFPIRQSDGRLHPNHDGHRLGYALAFNQTLEAAVASGAPLSPAGLPRNPRDSGLVQSRTSTTNETSEATGSDGPTPRIEYARIDQTATACPDEVVAGSTLTVSATGFAPGSTVRLEDGRDQLLRTVVADAAGVARADTVAGDAVDLAGWWLSGLSPEGGLLNAIAVTRIVDEPSPCDIEGPTVSVVSPAPGSVLELGERVAVEFSCDDPSGVASCDGTPANGTLVPTALPGFGELVVQATDVHGNLTVSRTTWQVGELAASATVGFDGFAAPPETNLGKAGRTFPIRFTIQDAQGAPVVEPDRVEVVVAQRGCDDGTVGTQVTAEDAGQSGLRIGQDGVWRFGWDTARSSAGTCAVLAVKVDGTTSEDVLWFDLG